MKHAAVIKWNDEKVALLRQLIAEGLSASVIGVRLGCSRNAIIGKCHRAGLYFNKDRALAPTNKPRNRRRDKAVHLKIHAVMEKKMQVAKHETVEQEFLSLEKPSWDWKDHFRPPPGKRTLTIEELGFWTCRWPFDVGAEHRYCGDRAVQGSPYCSYHTQIASRTSYR